MDFVHSMWTTYAMQHIKPSKVPVLVFYNYKGKGRGKNHAFSNAEINREIKYLRANESTIIKTCTGVGHNIYYYHTKWLMLYVKEFLNTK
jgi:hypothetical protein